VAISEKENNDTTSCYQQYRVVISLSISWIVIRMIRWCVSPVHTPCLPRRVGVENRKKIANGAILNNDSKIINNRATYDRSNSHKFQRRRRRRINIAQESKHVRIVSIRRDHALNGSLEVAWAVDGTHEIATPSRERSKRVLRLISDNSCDGENTLTQRRRRQCWQCVQHRPRRALYKRDGYARTILCRNVVVLR